jgi:hypothetical protein
MPVANQQVATGMQQARLMGLQRAVASSDAPTQRADVQAAGAQQATAAGGIATGAAEQQVKQAGQLGQLAVADQQTAAAVDVNQRRVAADNAVRQNEAEIAAMGLDLKQDIFDRQMKFEHDEAGRVVMNDAQIADWAILKAKDHQEFESRMQDMKLASERRSQMLEIAHKRIIQEMENISKGRILDANGKSMARLAQAKAEIEAKLERAAADAKNRQSMWTMGGTIVGGAAGAYFGDGNPAAIGLGMAVGGAVGSMAGSQAEQQQSGGSNQSNQQFGNPVA